MTSSEPASPSGGRLWVKPLDGPLAEPSPKVPADMRRLEAADAAALAVAMGLDGRATVAGRLATGRRPYGAWVDGHLAAYGWVSFEDEPIGERQLRLHLKPGEAYVFDCATRPAHQRQGLYSALLRFVLRDLQRDGLRRAWIGADLSNAASHRGIERAGFVAVLDLLNEDAPGGPSRRLVGLPGVPDALVADGRWALFGDREPW
jgi:ribosomal protein S18 acetylase RimI-like enzyme